MTLVGMYSGQQSQEHFAIHAVAFTDRRHGYERWDTRRNMNDQTLPPSKLDEIEASLPGVTPGPDTAELVRGYREAKRLRVKIKVLKAAVRAAVSDMHVAEGEAKRLRVAIEAHREDLNRARENGEGDSYEWEISDMLWAVLDDV